MLQSRLKSRNIQPWYLIILLGIFPGCNQKKESLEIVVKYYNNGVPELIGKMRNKKIYVDTLTFYHKTGHIKEIRILDQQGNTNGPDILFDSSGHKTDLINYQKGKAIGNGFTYFPNGAIKTSSFYYDDNLVGDKFFYNINGKVDTFLFYNLRSELEVEKKFLDGELIMQRYNSYFDDSVLESSNDQQIQLLILAAHPPDDPLRIVINKINSGNRIYDSILFSRDKIIDTIDISLEKSLKKISIKCYRTNAVTKQDSFEERIIVIQ